MTMIMMTMRTPHHPWSMLLLPPYHWKLQLQWIKSHHSHHHQVQAMPDQVPSSLHRHQLPIRSHPHHHNQAMLHQQGTSPPHPHHHQPQDVCHHQRAVCQLIRSMRQAQEIARQWVVSSPQNFRIPVLLFTCKWILHKGDDNSNRGEKKILSPMPKTQSS